MICSVGTVLSNAMGEAMSRVHYLRLELHL